MNILFVYSLHYFRVKRKQLVADTIQLGISYISSLLKKYGHNTRLIVLSRFFIKGNKKIIDDYIKNFKPKLICFTAVATEYPFIAGIAKYIKQNYPSIYLLIGGSHVSLNPENILLDDFDALCIGEGEYPVLELVSQLQNNISPSGIANLWIKQSGGIEKNIARPFLEDLDSLPFPDRQMWEPWLEPKDARYSVLLGRGCPFNCTYCCNHALRELASGDYVRFRSPDNIVVEIKDMQSRLAIKNEIYLEVETIAVNKEWAIELCSKLESFNSTLSQPLTFGANIRVTPDIDLDSLFAAMKRCNVRFINIGLESGCERVRKQILNREYSNYDIINSVKLARKYGFKICFFNMLGIPGETIADFKQTIQINRQCLPDWHFTSIFFPYPGTELYRQCIKQSLLDRAINIGIERQQASLDLPEFPKNQINKSFTWFDYYVYRGHRPLYKILIVIFESKLKSLIGALLLSNKDKYIKPTVYSKNNIRITLVCTSVNQLGGTCVHLMNMYKYLNNEDFKVFIICSSSVESDLKKFMFTNGVDEEDLIILSRLKKWFILPFIFELKKVFRAKNIDIVHLFQIQSDILGAIAARLAGIKNIISHCESKIVEDNISIFKQLFYRIANFFIKDWFKKTVVVSNGLKQELIIEKFRPGERIEVIHLGVAIPDVYRNQEFLFANLKNNKPVIGTISRLSREKGIDRFVSIMPLIIEQLPEANFLIVGNGDQEKSLRARINRFNLTKKVKFNQMAFGSAFYSGLENIDIFIMPSLREGCPNVLLEALALARPVVASKIEGIKDIIEDDKDGLLVDTTDSSQFAKRVLNLCQNPDKAIALGECGRQKILSNFTIEYEMQRYRKLYEEVLREGNL